MTVKKQKVELRISRVICSNREPDGSFGYIAVSFVDPVSGIEFVDARVPFAQFGSMIVNGPSVEVDAELRGLEYIGKKRIYEHRKIFCPIMESQKDNEGYRQWLEENAQEKGWILSTYLGSRDSIKAAYAPPADPNNPWKKEQIGTTLSYGVYKYVDPEL